MKILKNNFFDACLDKGHVKQIISSEGKVTYGAMDPDGLHAMAVMYMGFTESDKKDWEVVTLIDGTPHMFKEK